MINADDFYGRDAYLRAAAISQPACRDEHDQGPMAMVGYPLENTLSDHGHVNRGICTHR